MPAATPRADALQDQAESVAFVTGATGFLGSYVLRELLDRNNKMRVIAHMRCKDSAAGFLSVEAATEAYGLWCEDLRYRLRVVPGDISKPKLGLAADD